MKQALSLPVKHLSAYSLMFEEGTLLTHMRDGGQIDEIDEDLSLRMYDVLLDMTEKRVWSIMRFLIFLILDFVHIIIPSIGWEHPMWASVLERIALMV